MAAFITENRTASRIYMLGRTDGYVHGHADGHREAADAAELAARAYYAMDAAEAHTRAFSRAAADALTVPRFQDRPTPVATVKPVPTLEAFMSGLRRGGWLRDVQEVAA
ncbi:hypothetical protein [Arthrobacter ginkgonis]